MWFISVCSTKLQFQRARIKWYLDLTFYLHLLSHAWHIDKCGAFFSKYLSEWSETFLHPSYWYDQRGSCWFAEALLITQWQSLFGCVGSSLQCMGFLWLRHSGASLAVVCSLLLIMVWSLERAWAQQLWHRLSCLVACRILVPWPGMNSSPLHCKADS